jgi:glycosyltransferase involved in cell wall biosynthesis
MDGKRILIISYYFPPNPGVGSRRWAKYGKVLRQKGCDVHVLTARTPHKARSAWDEDVKDLKVFPVEPKYPRILNNWEKKSLLGKIRYKFMNAVVKMRVRGMHYDRAVFWRSTMLKKARQIIKQKKIEVIIVSTPPHRSAYYALELKRDHPEIKLMIDLRDPWTWGSFREYPNLKNKDRKFEEMMAAAVMENSDTLIVPVQKMYDSLLQKYPDTRRKLYLLSSAFDLDDFANINPRESSSGIRKFIYFGTLYDNLDDHFNGIANALSGFRGQFVLDIYSKRETYKKIFDRAGLLDYVNYHAELPSGQIFQKVVDADFVFLFKPYEYGKDNVSTKYFEITNSKTPVFLIADRGRASEYIVNNKLGIHTEVADTESTLRRLMQGNLTVDYNTEFSVEDYSFQHLGEKFIEEQLK